ncbi:hypothetical protein WR25_21469 [Diploscapter pachys]|uniref:non-specific serine/threonine protein kinase n=1 Tax=Diploscapter pachys TaxID=2018661 RepID=A0A2A2JF73_9BILA|nr:hypothetical protein WR25_21469 [Diploscapter pachys]
MRSSTSPVPLPSAARLQPSPSRIKRLASNLCIRISLHPSSPPPLSISPSPSCLDSTSSSAAMSYLQLPSLPFHYPEDSRLLSPPPDKRRASTISDVSSVTIPMSSSYQNLLSPIWSTTKYYPDEMGGTPPNEKDTYLHVRPASAQSNVSSECICPPVLLSPVLSRPIRSLSTTSSPVPPHRQHGSDSESDIGSGHWRAAHAKRNITSSLAYGNRMTEGSSSRPNTPTISPILNRSTSGSRLALALQGMRSSGSGSMLLPGRISAPTGSNHLYRTNSDADRKKKRTRRRTMAPGMCSESSMESGTNWPSSSNLSFMRSCLGHSDPQISATSSTSSTPKFTKDVHNLSHSSSSARSTTARRSLNASTSPVTSLRSRSPAGRPVFPSRTTAPVAVNLRSTSCRNQSSLMAPVHDSRRWSLASLPSTSGYGTPGTEHGTGSNSAFSSQCSSSEHLHEMMECMRVGGHSGSHHAGAGHRFDSNESCPSEDTQLIAFRPRSRSLTSPVMFDTEFHVDVVNRNSVYKEKFPKAKAQMEDRLNAFVNANAPLSGSTSSDVGDNTAGNRKSMIFDVDPSIDRNLLRLIADGATRFLHHQIVEIASDCLARSKDDLITCSYFCEMSQRLDETLNEAQSKTSAESFAYLSKLVQQLLMIVSRPARLLECLEFDPNEFYELLEEAEGVVREQLGSGTAKVPDLPQYIISKLGLDRDPLLDTAEDEGKEVQKQEKSEEKIKCAEKQTITLHESVNPKAPCEDDFETIRLVSNGAYGAVYLVRHRETRQRFALKKMNKQTLVLRNQVEQVFAERDILTMTDNPFVVSFYGSFETKHHLCMLLEYVEGGDCASLLKSAGTLPLDLARLYVAETILAIDYLHSYGIVHRDIKPDNMLITSMGHIKLTDFGLSKIGLMNRTTLVAEGFDAVDTHQFKDKQLCGTPEYIAPEVILRQGYGKPVDWWALGVILYEFLIGIVPFYGDSPEDLFSKVISEEVEYPEGEEALPQEAEDLIRKLLEKNPNERLGTLNGAPQLISHAFFDPLDFTTLLRQKAEFVPQLDNEEDTSYFDTRSDRYNHEAESCGEDEASTPMFHSFSTASPRHSIASLDPTQLPQFVQHSTSPPHAATSSAAPVTATDRPRKTSSTATQSSEDHASMDLPESECPIPSAVLLRRRFSAQRQANLSTSSSGTTGLNTAGSSTDSSIDASNTSNVAVFSSVPSANESRRLEISVLISSEQS